MFNITYILSYIIKLFNIYILNIKQFYRYSDIYKLNNNYIYELMVIIY